MISMNKQYQNKRGDKVRILCVDEPGDYPVAGIVYTYDSKYKYLQFYDKEGHAAEHGLDTHALIEVSQYSKFKVDEQVLVYDEDRAPQWVKRHFAGISPKGKPLVWKHGKTSFTSCTNETEEWQECITYKPYSKE